MILTRLIAILVIVILGCIAAEELFRTLTSILPLLIVLTAAIAIGGGWARRRRRF